MESKDCGGLERSHLGRLGTNTWGWGRGEGGPGEGSLKKSPKGSWGPRPLTCGLRAFNLWWLYLQTFEGTFFRIAIWVGKTQQSV